MADGMQNEKGVDNVVIRWKVRLDGNSNVEYGWNVHVIGSDASIGSWEVNQSR